MLIWRVLQHFLLHFRRKAPFSNAIHCATITLGNNTHFVFQVLHKGWIGYEKA